MTTWTASDGRGSQVAMRRYECTVVWSCGHTTRETISKRDTPDGAAEAQRWLIADATKQICARCSRARMWADQLAHSGYAERQLAELKRQSHWCIECSEIVTSEACETPEDWTKLRVVFDAFHQNGGCPGRADWMEPIDA